MANLRRQRYPQRKPSIALNIQGGRSRRRKMKELTNWPGQFHSSFFNAFSDSFGSFRVVSFLYQFSARIFFFFYPQFYIFIAKFLATLFFMILPACFGKLKFVGFAFFVVILAGSLSRGHPVQVFLEDTIFPPSKIELNTKILLPTG